MAAMPATAKLDVRDWANCPWQFWLVAKGLPYT